MVKYQYLEQGEVTIMAISFKGAKNYKKHNGLDAGRGIKTPIPSEMHYYSLLQNDLTLLPKVEEGERVISGQKIADIDEFDAIPVLSSISGRVLSVSKSQIAIENDMMFVPSPVIRPAKTADELTTREILWLLREGCVFEPRENAPLHVLLASKRVSDCIIVCCFDSDPYVSSPQAAAMNNCEIILEALKVAMRISGITKAFIAVENDTKGTFADFKRALRYNPDIEPVILKARYPQSDSEILIRTVTGSENTNALILSPETLCNMHRVLTTGAPVLGKIVTVSGDEILEPENFYTPVGATCKSVIESGGYSECELVIDGGVIDGDVITVPTQSVTYGTKAFVAFHNKKNVPKYRKKLL